MTAPRLLDDGPAHRRHPARRPARLPVHTCRSMRLSWIPTRAAAAAAATLLVLVAGVRPASAAPEFAAVITQEEDEFEARFPDILRLDDGRYMAVWYRATEHAGTIGTVELSFTRPDGSWEEGAPALARPSAFAGRDMRDPKLGKLADGTVVLTFFTPGDDVDPGVYYAVWKPGWNRFTDPLKFTDPALPRVASHGSPLALTGSGDVLIPVYDGVPGPDGGAYFLRTTLDPVTLRFTIKRVNKIISNTNPVGRMYFEPSFVQFGDTIVAAIRSETADGTGGRVASPVVIGWWNAYADLPAYTFQSFSNVMASSHHLLKTSDGRVLFTYGDKSQQFRPTVGMMITNPTQPWVKGKVVTIYNVGADDQANPSSVETSPGHYWTLAYNAKPKRVTAEGGKLRIISSVDADYRP